MPIRCGSSSAAPGNVSAQTTGQCVVPSFPSFSPLSRWLTAPVPLDYGAQTAHQELRFLRAMGRIEQLKQEGRWSFRQPKKQKGPPVGKSSWDWMLEEMVRRFAFALSFSLFLPFFSPSLVPFT